MDLYEVLDLVVDLLRSRRRVTYRVLKRQFDLDDELLEDLKEELIYGQKLAVDEDNRVLVWAGEATVTPDPTLPPSQLGQQPTAHEGHIFMAERRDAERRQLTVMFCDLVGSTALSSQLDPEDLREVIQAYQTACAKVIQRYDGYIAQYLGDGLLIYFGYPRAHEDDAQRAVRTGLEIVEAMEELNIRLQMDYGVGLAVRVGLHTGLVVVGEMGTADRHEQLALGATPNIAARLQSFAQPGSVVISALTHRLVADLFAMRDLGEHEMKGYATPIQVYEVLHAHRQRSRLEVAATRGLTPHVAREQEITLLEEWFQQVKAGQGQVVFITGNAGVGKSRLLFEFRTTLARREEAATWLEGRCLSFGQMSPFLPIVDQLRANFGIDDMDSTPSIIAKVETDLQRMGGLEPYMAAIRYLLSVDSGDDELATLEPAVRRKRLFDALLALAERGSRVQPLVLVYEDLHWIDSSTEAFLHTLIDYLADLPILLLMSHRPEYTPPFEPRVFFSTLALRSFTQQDTLQMAARLLGTDHIPATLQTVLFEKTEGIPLFVEEVINSLIEAEVLQRDNGHYRFVAEQAEVQISDTLQGLIMTRLDRLAQDSRHAAQQAAVIGRQFLFRLLERIADITGQLEDALSELQDLELVYLYRHVPESIYAFKHALIQDVVYNSILRRRRRDLHRAVGEAMEELYAERLAEHYEELAHHFHQAEAWPKAMNYSALAGDRAVNAFANAEAKAHYTRALEAAHQMTPYPDAQQLAPLHVKYGSVLMVLGDYDDAIRAYQEALSWTRQSGNRRSETEILAGLSQVYAYCHRAEPALESINDALALAEEQGDLALQGVSLATRAFIRSVGYGHMIEALPDTEKALQLAKEINNPKLQAQTLVDLGSVLQWRGLFEQSLPHLRKGAELSYQLQAVQLYGRALFFMGIAHASIGAYDDALDFYRQLSAYASDAGNTYFMARTPNVIGGVHLELFDLAEALERNLEGLEVAKQLFPWPEPQGHSLLKIGLVYLLRQDYSQAESYFRQAEALLEQDEWLRWRWYIPLLHARGELALAQGQLEAAAQFAGQSMEIARRTDSQKHIARAHKLHGDLHTSNGQLEEATKQYTASMAIAEQTGVLRELWMGRAALGNVLESLGQEREAEIQLRMACETIEAIAAKLRMPRLREHFLSAPQVQSVYESLGQRPPSSSGRDV